MDIAFALRKIVRNDVETYEDYTRQALSPCLVEMAVCMASHVCAFLWLCCWFYGFHLNGLEFIFVFKLFRHYGNL